MIKKLLLAATLSVALAGCGTTVPSGSAYNNSVIERIVALFSPSAAHAQAPAPATQNTITTTAPVSSETTISVGTLAGQVLMWLAAAFSVPIGSLLAMWLVRLLKLTGVQVTQQMSDQLDKTLVNGLNDGAAAGAGYLKDKASIVSKDAVVASAVAYAQAHRAETIQALGLDPKSGAAVAALKARIATLVADPSTPTPAVLDPAGAPAKV